MISLIGNINIGVTLILDLFKKLIRSAMPQDEPVPEEKVRIYPRAEHPISRAQISENALKVLYRLQKEGFDAYLVGGCVRDLLLGREPKDFDVVTNADPEQVRRVFRNCRIIGRRFRLAHVHFGREVIEVATFRGSGDADGDEKVLNQEGRLLRDNVYGTIEEDVWRRDFTINALYYNIKDFSVVDYVHGMEDHRNATLRLIGDAKTRFREDPVRMLRAVRFSVKLSFTLHPDCEQAMQGMAGLLASIPPARIYDEVLKLFLFGYASQTYEMLRHFGLFQVLFPETEQHLAAAKDSAPHLLLSQAFRNSDLRIAEGKSVTAYFLFAALLWEPVCQLATQKMAEGELEYLAFQETANEVIARQCRHTAMPRHISLAIREVWGLQPKFNARSGSKPARLLTHPRFRAAFDFLLLRAETGGADPELASWWQTFQNADEDEQRKMTQPVRRTAKGKSARKRNYRKKSASVSASEIQS